MTSPPVSVATPVQHRHRSDIEGMRAVAVALVIAYHAGAGVVTGGYVGVDVFFVISGFLITGLLLREHDLTSRVSLVGFYARRVRRILPASTLTILLTTVATYHWLGFLVGNRVAVDGQWAGLFAANLHFAAIGTTYLGAQQQPSPLQHMWSLGVEEQFYVVWPALAMAVLWFARRGRLSARGSIGGVLGLVIVASLAWSVVQTHTDAQIAYFSPLTRGWELAVGGAIACAVPLLARLPRLVLDLLALAGLAVILLAAVVLDPATPFPGYRATLPVLGAALLIAGGCGTGATIVGRGLSLAPLRWLGRISYSLYLAHWPVLTIAEQNSGHPLHSSTRVGLVALVMVLAAGSYVLVEQPFRRNALLARGPRLCLVVGLIMIALTIVVTQALVAGHLGGWIPLHISYAR